MRMKGAVSSFSAHCAITVSYTHLRRPGVGVWLKGEKLSCRRAAAALLQSSLTEEELQAVLRGNFAAGGAFAALLNTKIAEREMCIRDRYSTPAALIV